MGTLLQLKHRITDSLTNFVNGLGGALDPRTQFNYSFTALNRMQLEYAYRGDWLARRIVDAPAEDTTRKWRQWKASQKQIETLEEAERKMDLRRRFRRALAKARLYGGSALVMGIANQGTSEMPIDVELVKKDDLKFIAVFHQYELTPGPRIKDINSEWFGQPEYYTLATGNIEGLDAEAQLSQGVRIHPSRVIALIGNELPDDTMMIPANVWGDSVLQVVDEALKQSGSVIGGVAGLVVDAKMDIINIPGLTAKLADDDASAALVTRMARANQVKSTISTLMLDEKETWQRIQTNFGALPPLVEQYIKIACGAAQIPATRILGNSHGGLGGKSGGESDIRNYYDDISSMQENELSPALTPLDNVFIRSTFGTHDDSIYYEWAPLWELSETEKADIISKKAVATQADVTMNLINPDALRAARINQLIEDGTYPGLEDAIAEFGDAPEEPVIPSPENLTAHIGMLQKSSQQLSSLAKPAMKALPAPKSKKVGDGFDPNQLRDENGQWVAEGVGIDKSFDTEGGGYSGTNRLTHSEAHSKLKGLGFTRSSKKEQTVSTKMGRSQAYSSSKHKESTYDHPSGVSVHVKTKASPEHTLSYYKVSLKKKVTDTQLSDAEPRSLYVRRDVLNAPSIVRWAKAQGFTTTLPAEEMHVTICYSRSKVDWMQFGSDYVGFDQNGKLVVPMGGPRMLDMFGPEKNVVVLLFYSGDLKWRHERFVSEGASWDYPEYQPHITITMQKPEGMDISKVEPYQGPIVLGPEIFSEIEENAMADVVEDALELPLFLKSKD